MPCGGFILAPRSDSAGYRGRYETVSQVEVNEVSGLVSGSSFLAVFVCNHTNKTQTEINTTQQQKDEAPAQNRRSQILKHKQNGEK